MHRYALQSSDHREIDFFFRLIVNIKIPTSQPDDPKLIEMQVVADAQMNSPHAARAPV
jgi:hypothetical protein